jgi:hypothetical protein
MTGPWVLLDAHCSQQDKNAERLGFVMVRSFFLLEEDAKEFALLMKKEPPGGKSLRDAPEGPLHVCGRNSMVRYISTERTQHSRFRDRCDRREGVAERSALQCTHHHQLHRLRRATAGDSADEATRIRTGECIQEDLRGGTYNLNLCRLL